jgi:hypothetical protein
MRAMVRDTYRIALDVGAVRVWAAIRFALGARRDMRCGASYIVAVF